MLRMNTVKPSANVTQGRNSMTARAVCRPRRMAKQQFRSCSLTKFQPQAKSVVQRRSVSVQAEAVETAVTWTPVLRAEDMRKGERQMVSAAGKSIMMFYYRNDLVAIESRSPAEGAYSNGFVNARFTQDYCIECPTTATKFSMKTGEIVDWYPNNPVLRAVTPQDTCRPLEVFPVKIDGDTIYVDAANSNLAGTGFVVSETATTAGGADTSLENNNVFGIEPRMYLETGEEITDEASGPASNKLDPATLIISTLAVATIAVAGSATCLYYENLVALGVLWVVGFGVVAKFVLDFQNVEDSQ
eukprot:CAMPEP_0118931932 /NCGR_PEP_ID=MMETSP1169-20130426/8719_1 /TAXON_ID=36882 /ORGANISM="Pyramimonas obovata, Strain CCMP722" /LENGTH=300 /DNA_ID=CAMNT_0006874509 /DNA_START=65 /DNA_END=967 /DNA_ORIENTATION=+